MEWNDLFCVFAWINRIIYCGLVYDFAPFIIVLRALVYFSFSFFFVSSVFLLFSFMKPFFMTICGFTSMVSFTSEMELCKQFVFLFFLTPSCIRFVLLYYRLIKMRLSLNSMEIKTFFFFSRNFITVSYF